MAIQSVALSDDAGVRALPSAAALADGTVNPTASQLAAALMRFNGTTWDRARGNWNVATGDSGAKTTSFFTATMTNFDARGAFIVVQLGTVTGTSPTLNFFLQWSPDGGTTFFNLGPASANLTASSQSLAFFVYPTNMTIAGATPTSLTTGATQSLFLNTPLPRTWRLTGTMGGTTPSFTISSIWVSYLL